MAANHSRPVEDWTEEIKRVDALIVGSGYGGSVAAYRLAEAKADVVVLERGKEYSPGDFPAGLGDVPGHVQFRRPNDAQAIGYADGLYDIRFGDDVDVLVGSGLGGTSLINANVAVEPDAAVFQRAGWPAAIAAEAADAKSPFREAFGEMRALLRPVPGPATAKRAALETLASRIGAECRPADITVTLQASHNAAGIWQAACTLCGNCVTGCNVGAKNTLAMNLIPLAARKGARFFTGASVIAVEKSGDAEYPWQVRYRRTATIKKPLAPETYVVQAKFVVLAAGTLGSTEILMRSRKPGELEFSEALGRHFSTNGDALASGYAQAARVDAMGQTPQQGDWSVGPTICGIASVRAPVPESNAQVDLTVEDGAVPVAMNHLFGELITTGAQAARLVNVALPAWHERERGADPIALHAGAMAHTQVLLVMGDDGAEGRLTLVSRDAEGNPVEPHVKVDWPGAGENPALRAADALLAEQDRAAGFDGGQYVANPLWKLLPDDARSVMSGKLPGGRVVTVHPLGGCAMADDAADGVVNDTGRVYARNAKTRFHDGLYVLDGAVVPRALGVNPFLTISALAWRACDDMLPRLRQAARGMGLPAAIRTVALEIGALEHPEPPRDEAPAPDAAPRRGGNDAEPVEREVAVELTELLVGKLDEAPPAALFGPAAARLAEHQGMLLRISIDMPSVERWYANPGAERLDARARLYAHPLSAKRVQELHACDLGRDVLDGLTPLLTLEGKVQLFGRLPCGRLKRWARAVAAILAYVWRRRSVVNGNLLSGFRQFFNVALNHADYRTMDYELRAVDGVHEVVITGSKLLAWRPFNRRIWSALTNLPITLDIAAGGERTRIDGLLGVHMEHMAGDGVAQVRSTPHLPATVSALSGVGMYFLRALLQTSFWEFGAPAYPSQPLTACPNWPRLRPPGATGSVAAVVQVLPVRMSDTNADKIDLWLTRYPQPPDRKAHCRPALLIHGLAQGSRIYTSEAMYCNFAAYLWQEGYDVWLVDYRLSNRILPDLRDEDWSLEEIARYDIAAAVDAVFTRSGQPVSVFAHCVGATTLAMAALKGWVQPSRLRCVAFNAIHPWVITSPVNRFRSALGAFFRDAVGRDLLDPIPQAQPSPAQVVLDRLAYSVARYNEERAHRHSRCEDELPQAMCDRMTFLYGRMWRHLNLEPALHASFGDILGPAPGSVYRHLYYFSKIGRLTDAQGQNTFLTEENIRERWTFDTFFLHGELSEVFNPQSATRSAVRMKRVLVAADRPDQRVWLKRVQDYGHMDVVFAQDAYQRVYPEVERFFRTDRTTAPESPDTFDESSDAGYAAPLDLTAGPVIRRAAAENGEVCARLWGELHDDAASRLVALAPADAGLTAVKEQPVPLGEARCRLLDVVVAPAYDDGIVRARADVDSPVVWDSGQRGVYFHGEGEGVPAAAAVQGARAAALPHRWSWLNRLRARAQGAQLDDFHFLVGSCRYPGTTFERDAADAVFAGMLPHLEESGNGRTGVDLLLLVGDQIYADATAGLLDSKGWRERYSARYREAFTAPNLRRVLASVPTHFAVDDHEFSDDWSGLPQPGDPLPVDDRASEGIAKALCAAACFQSAARSFDPADTRPRFWYALDGTEATCPVFVMDTRSERQLRYASGGGKAQFLSDGQWQALGRWLTSAQRMDPARPKFLVCGSVIAPVASAYVAHPATFRNEDGWVGYPGALARLLELVLDRGIGNLVVVAGDLHFSAVTKLEVARGEKAATVWHIVSSGLYSPMPFANADPDDMSFSGTLPIEGRSDITVTMRGATLCAGLPHFVRVDAGPEPGRGWRIAVSAHDANGSSVATGLPPPGVVASAGAWVITLEPTTHVVAEGNP